eukprot:10528737-Prorocentrum_lima.AAC.1
MPRSKEQELLLTLLRQQIRVLWKVLDGQKLAMHGCIQEMARWAVRCMGKEEQAALKEGHRPNWLTATWLDERKEQGPPEEVATSQRASNAAEIDSRWWQSRACDLWMVFERETIKA